MHRTRRRARGGIRRFTPALPVALGVATPAVATPGQIGYDGCLADEATRLCADLPGAPLDGAVGVAVSPDGASVYVAAQDSDAVSQFVRKAAGGRIGLGGCLANGSAPPCRPPPLAPLAGASGVAVSRDGRSVYVVSASTDSIAHFFRRGPKGRLTYDGCLADDSAQGCQDLPGSPLGSAFGVAVSPDGRSVYVSRPPATPSPVSPGTVTGAGSRTRGASPTTPASSARTCRALR